MTVGDTRDDPHAAAAVLERQLERERAALARASAAVEEARAAAGWALDEAALVRDCALDVATAGTFDEAASRALTRIITAVPGLAATITLHEGPAERVRTAWIGFPGDRAAPPPPSGLAGLDQTQVAVEHEAGRAFGVAIDEDADASIAERGGRSVLVAPALPGGRGGATMLLYLPRSIPGEATLRMVAGASIVVGTGLQRLLDEEATSLLHRELRRSVAQLGAASWSATGATDVVGGSAVGAATEEVCAVRLALVDALTAIAVEQLDHALARLQDGVERNARVLGAALAAPEAALGADELVERLRHDADRTSGVRAVVVRGSDDPGADASRTAAVPTMLLMATIERLLAPEPRPASPDAVPAVIVDVAFRGSQLDVRATLEPGHHGTADLGARLVVARLLLEPLEARASIADAAPLTVSITLPCGAGGPSPAPRRDPAPAAPGGPEPAGSNSRPGDQPRVRRHVLVVEDNPVNQDVLRGQLERLGHAVMTTASSDGMWDVLEGAGPVDVILMDCDLGGESGLDVARELRSRGVSGPAGAYLPIVAVTAHVLEDDRARCFDAGMDAFLSKPIRSARLAEVLDSVAPDCAGQPSSRSHGPNR